MTAECSKTVRHKIIKVKESGKSVRFHNTKREKIVVSQVDGCLIKDGKRCDNIVSSNEISILIEFKGHDIHEACQQFQATLEHKAIRPLLKPKLGFLVVCRRVPAIDTTIQRKMQDYALRLKAGFHVRSGDNLFHIDRVAAIDGPF
jgi:hypothetical protein